MICTELKVVQDNTVPKLIKQRNSKFDDQIRNSPLWELNIGFVSFGEGALEVYNLKDGTLTYFCSATLENEDLGLVYHYPRIKRN